MAEVCIVVRDKTGSELFFATGMGRCYSAAKAQAMQGVRARLAADKALYAKVHTMNAEAL